VQNFGINGNIVLSHFSSLQLVVFSNLILTRGVGVAQPLFTQFMDLTYLVSASIKFFYFANIKLKQNMVYWGK